MTLPGSRLTPKKLFSMICSLSTPSSSPSFTTPSSSGSWCVAALRNLLSTSANHNRMLLDGVVDALVLLSSRTDEEFIAFNSAAALRTMTYGKATRKALLDKGAISVIIDQDDDGAQFEEKDKEKAKDKDKDKDKEKSKTISSSNNAADSDDDLKIGKGLLQQIEAESWANGSRGIQREGRASALPQPSLLTGAGGGEMFLVDIRAIPTTWSKVRCGRRMNEPELSQTPKVSDIDIRTHAIPVSSHKKTRLDELPPPCPILSV